MSEAPAIPAPAPSEDHTRLSLGSSGARVGLILGGAEAYCAEHLNTKHFVAKIKDRPSGHSFSMDSGICGLLWPNLLAQSLGTYFVISPAGRGSTRDIILPPRSWVSSQSQLIYAGK